MRKYRILEVNNCFYPQEKKWFSWVYLDNLIPRVTWSKRYICESVCSSKDYAEKVIEKRIMHLGSGKKIVHEYKQEDK